MRTKYAKNLYKLQLKSMMSAALAVNKLKSIDPKIQSVVYGFIRDAQKMLPADNNPYYIIPELIIYLVLRFYYLSFRFDICTSNMDVIKDDGTIFRVLKSRRNEYVNAGDSHGRKSGVCTIKVNKLGYVRFGITTIVRSIETDKGLHTPVWYRAGHTYCAIGFRERVLGYEVGNPKEKFKHSGWSIGDVIKMEWTETGILKFYTNDIQIGQIRIAKGLIYYPFVQRYNSDAVELEIM